MQRRTHDIDVTLTPTMHPKESPAYVAGHPLEAPVSRARLQGSMGSVATLAAPSATTAIREADPAVLAAVLEQENARSISLFISALESDLDSKTLANLSPSKQNEVAEALSSMEAEPESREVAQVVAQVHLKLRKTAR